MTRSACGPALLTDHLPRQKLRIPRRGTARSAKCHCSALARVDQQRVTTVDGIEPDAVAPLERRVASRPPPAPRGRPRTAQVLHPVQPDTDRTPTGVPVPGTSRTMSLASRSRSAFEGAANTSADVDLERFKYNGAARRHIEVRPVEMPEHPRLHRRLFDHVDA